MFSLSAMVISKHAWRHTGSYLLLLALLVRTMMPMGYMPGDIFAGESLLVVCPTGLPQDSEDHQHHHGNSHADPGEQSDLDTNDACPFALLLNPEVPVQPTVALIVEAPQQQRFKVILEFAIAASQRRPSIRAPPLLTLTKP